MHGKSKNNRNSDSIIFHNGSSKDGHANGSITGCSGKLPLVVVSGLGLDQSPFSFENQPGLGFRV